MKHEKKVDRKRKLDDSLKNYYAYQIKDINFALKSINECNIEIRDKGIIIYFKSKQSTYGLAIPYYKLVIFKVDSNHYTITYNEYFLKIRVKNNSDHKFFKKVSEHKAIFLNN